MRNILKIKLSQAILLVIPGVFSGELHFKGYLGTPINTGLGFGLVLPGIKPKPEPVLTNIYVAIWQLISMLPYELILMAPSQNQSQCWLIFISMLPHGITRGYWVNFDDTKPKPEPVLTYIYQYVATWHHQGVMS